MKRKTLLVLSLCLSLFLFLNGCSNSAAKKPITPTPQKKMTQTQTSEMTASDRRVMASKLSKLAEEVEGVNKATVVVANVGMSNTTTTNNSSSNNNNNNSNNINGQNKNIVPKNDIWLEGNQGKGIIVMVGLTLDQAKMKDSNKEGAIQTMVINKLKASDSRISQVLVSTDPNMIKRINDIAAGILEGKPIKTFEKDINDLNTKFKQKQPAI